MAGVGGNLDLGRELAELEQSNPALGRVLRRLQEGVNTLAKNTAASATGETKAPQPPSTVQLAQSGEYLHFSIDHPGELQRGVTYFTEIHSDDPATAGKPIVYHHGSSRTPPPLQLPSKRFDPVSGTNVFINYSTQHYAQYPSSQPSSPIAGRIPGTGATTFQMTGGTVMSLLPSTGSGTASNTGQQKAQGLGKVQQRLAILNK